MLVLHAKHDVIMTSVTCVTNETPFKAIIFAIMNAITTNISSHKCQCAAPIVIFAILDVRLCF